MTAEAPKLPKLPEPYWSGVDIHTHRVLFTDAQMLAAMAQAAREQKERDAALCESRAGDIRKSNTYRGRANAAAEFAADQCEFAGSVIRSQPNPQEPQP